MSTQENRGCVFCGVEGQKIPETAFNASRPALQLYGAMRLLEGWILSESSQFIAVPDSLLIGDGKHLLIIPKKHTYS